MHAQTSVVALQSQWQRQVRQWCWITRKSVGEAGRAQRMHVKIQAGYSLATCKVRPGWMSSTRDCWISQLEGTDADCNLEDNNFIVDKMLCYDALLLAAAK